jgi:hypothetical protein
MNRLNLNPYAVINNNINHFYLKTDENHEN